MSSQMISRKSRRKTLSHAELEDFLCDLGPEAESEVVMGFDSYSNSGCDQSKMKVLEIDSDEQRVREYCKVTAHFFCIIHIPDFYIPLGTRNSPVCLLLSI
jgi:hypothetical protein